MEPAYDVGNEQGWACLHYAAFQGNIEFVELLIELRANGNKETSDNWTPLMLAAYQGHLECVKTLLAYQLIQVNKTTKRGTALHVAAYKGHADICTALLEGGANMSIFDGKGRIPLEVATSIEILELLPKCLGERELARLRTDPGDIPPPFAGELQYSSHLLRHKVYLVIDMEQAVLSRYSRREQYLEQKPPCFSVALAAVQHVAVLKSRYGFKHGFRVISPEHKSKYFAKHEEVATEWTERIIAAVAYSQQNSSVQHLSNRETFQTQEPLPDEDYISLIGSFRDTVAIRTRGVEDYDEYEPKGNPSFSDFRVLDELGAGSFGRVYKCVRKGEDVKLAMKVLNKRMIIRQKQVKYVLEENRIMKALKHPFIIHLYHTLQTPRSLVFIMELCPKGDLAAHISEKEHFTQDATCFYAAELVLALEYIHSKNIIFRDLKPENVLLDEKGHIRLADFGIARRLEQGEENAKTFAGTPAYLAPELFTQHIAGKAADIYGLGILIYEMLVGEPPFFSTNAHDLFTQIQQSPIQYPDYLSSAAIDLIQHLTDRNPALRPPLSSLRVHPFFSPINWILLKQKKVEPPLMSECWLREELDAGYPSSQIDKDYSNAGSMEECWPDFY
jgi:serum/glucocorticoid-regulated kinase 2